MSPRSTFQSRNSSTSAFSDGTIPTVTFVACSSSGRRTQSSQSANPAVPSGQLIDAETGAHLWAERFDKPVADLFDMQDEIVARLASQLGTQLIAAEARRAEFKFFGYALARYAALATRVPAACNPC